MNRGNNILNARSNCLIKDEGMHSQFSFRTPANRKEIPLKIINLEATFIDTYKKIMKKDINMEVENLKELELLQDKLDEENKKDPDNTTMNLFNAVKELNSSYGDNIKAAEDMKRNLHPQSTWDYMVSLKIGIILGIVTTLGLVTCFFPDEA